MPCRYRPTLIELMGNAAAKEMSGKSLLVKINLYLLRIRYKESANFLKADRTQKSEYSFAVQSPLLPQPVDVCNSKVEIFVQWHSIYFL